MGTTEADIIIGNIKFLIDERVPRLLASGPDAKLSLEVSNLHRRQGCGLLLSKLDEDSFSRCLREAARVYLNLLERKQKCSEFDQYYLARSKAEPFFDAVAIGEWGMARDIVSRLASSWMRRMETEEDFYYFGVLSKLLISGTVPQVELTAFETSLQGGTSCRFDVVRALHVLDVDGFEAGLEGLIGERIERLAREKRSGFFDPYFHATEAHVFVEGLALVRLANRLGMNVKGRYRTVPEIILGA